MLFLLCVSNKTFQEFHILFGQFQLSSEDSAKAAEKNSGNCDTGINVSLKAAVMCCFNVMHALHKINLFKLFLILSDMKTLRDYLLNKRINK